MRFDPARTTTATNDVAVAFADGIPSLSIIDDPMERALFSADIAGPAAATADAILQPQNSEEVEAIVAIARREGCALYPRGGGWSYSGGYGPSRTPAAIVDTGRLRAMTVAKDAGRVTIGAGVTWARLFESLDAAGLRVPSFGPLSGIGATVGGLVAQNGGFFGAAGCGPIADESLCASTVIAGSGEKITLTRDHRADGSAAPQPLAGDCGAFGLRVDVTLQAVARPATTAFASFAFAEGEEALAALRSLAGVPGLGEVFIFDPGTHANLARSGFSLAERTALAGDLMAARAGALRGIADVVRAARWSNARIADIPWSLHVSLDGDAAATRAGLADVVGRAQACGGNAIPDVIPRVTRARPFRRIKALLGPDGELWLATHGVFTLEAAARGFQATKALLADRAAVMRGHGIRATMLIVLMRDRIVIEPQLFWADSLSPLHRRLCPSDQVAAYGGRTERPAARAAVHELRRDLIAAMDAAGAAHFQIGRTYAAHPGVSEQARRAWTSWKKRLDPDRIMNPGVLGL